MCTPKYFENINITGCGTDLLPRHSRICVSGQTCIGSFNKGIVTTTNIKTCTWIKLKSIYASGIGRPTRSSTICRSGISRVIIFKRRIEYYVIGAITIGINECKCNRSVMANRPCSICTRIGLQIYRIRPLCSSPISSRSTRVIVRRGIFNVGTICRSCNSIFYATDSSAIRSFKIV